MRNIHFFSLFFLIGCLNSGFSQSYMDISIGSSQQDNFAVQFGLRKQFRPSFRAGIQYQYGSPNYRFIEAKPIQDEGYAHSISIPLNFRIYQQESLELYAYLNSGLRFQGVIDPDENDQRDSILTSSALVAEAGLLVNVLLSEQINFMSGVSFPIAYEFNPTNLMEMQATLIHAGLGFHNAKGRSFFFKANMGPAFGANGDTQKFLWALQAGIRFQLGKRNSNYAPGIIESSF